MKYLFFGAVAVALASLAYSIAPGVGRYIGIGEA